MTEPIASSNHASAPRSKTRRLAIKLSLLLISVCIGAAFLEIGVRWFLPQYAPERQIYFQMTNGFLLGFPSQTVRQRTPKGDYDLRITYNAQGFRDPRDLQQSTLSDWFVMGDSFSFGWGVAEEQRYSNLLESSLKTNGFKGRVFNIALPENIIGYQRLLAYAERHGAKVRQIIVGICMENDLRDYSDGLTASERDYRKIAPVSRKEQVKSFLKHRSALYVATSFTLHGIPFSRRLLEKAGLARNVQILSGKAEWNPKALETSREELLKLVKGREALILIIPARRLWHEADSKTEARVHDAFVTSLREAGLRIIDMRPVFEQSGDPLEHYFKTDSHWNAQGHARAASELSKAIGSLQTH